jgi:hypothetical protein
MKKKATNLIQHMFGGLIPGATHHLATSSNLQSMFKENLMIAWSILIISLIIAGLSQYIREDK